MGDKIMQINLSQYEGPVYSGRSRGESVRNQLNLDAVDRDVTTKVNVMVPDDTYTVTSSFFLGMFGPSIVRAGSRANFYKKFHINAKNPISQRIDSFVDRALQQKALFG